MPSSFKSNVERELNDVKHSLTRLTNKLQDDVHNEADEISDHLEDYSARLPGSTLIRRSKMWQIKGMILGAAVAGIALGAAATKLLVSCP